MFVWLWQRDKTWITYGQHLSNVCNINDTVCDRKRYFIVNGKMILNIVVLNYRRLGITICKQQWKTFFFSLNGQEKILIENFKNNTEVTDIIWSELY